MTTVGLRELRQQASELVRRVEAGEEITVTVSGRAAARLVAVAPRRWRTWPELGELFRGPPDTEWGADRSLIDQELRDRWETE